MVVHVVQGESGVTMHGLAFAYIIDVMLFNTARVAQGESEAIINWLALRGSEKTVVLPYVLILLVVLSTSWQRGCGPWMWMYMDVYVLLEHREP